MNVSELISLLKKLPQQALVVAEGYEDGYDAIKKVSVISVEENPTVKWYYGKYSDSKNSDALQAVFLDAESKADKI